MNHRHGGGPVRYRTRRGRIMHRERPLHPITLNRKREGRRGSRRMAWDIGGAEEELHRIEYMSPEEYLSRTGTSLKKFEEDPSWSGKYYDIEKEESRPIEELGEYIEDPDKKVTIPYVGEPKFFGILPIIEHEGRHRAYAAMLKGQKEIPVAVPLEKDERGALAEEFINRRFPDNADDRYLDEWRERFESGFPASSMDQEGRIIFKEILEERDIEEPE